ncbi:hypothetical protein K438DRAFT_1976621 [Mycena galopus ATCC 62051]|nr:hypothetical protein K438DRAFT_1976621 [Mycena galopus ATCC 62051]
MSLIICIPLAVTLYGYGSLFALRLFTEYSQAMSIRISSAHHSSVGMRRMRHLIRISWPLAANLYIFALKPCHPLPDSIKTVSAQSPSTSVYGLISESHRVCDMFPELRRVAASGVLGSSSKMLIYNNADGIQRLRGTPGMEPNCQWSGPRIVATARSLTTTNSTIRTMSAIFTSINLEAFAVSHRDGPACHATPLAAPQNAASTEDKEVYRHPDQSNCVIA